MADSVRIAVVVVGMFVFAFLSTGCATPAPPAGEAIGAAEYALRKAKEDGANESAPVDIRQIEDKIARAKSERSQGAKATATRLAHEAALEAQVAEAKAANARIHRARTEIEKGLDDLRAEIERQR
ncbi:MAG: DUF4398 domain-containing protein [Deltaproteobacteria bacterium]|nr:DUF4398 domain-containing protein [Deltaproteobacteria bacterium]MBW2396527.1 DUF4398 domain-containing protein [Deltaproteobacteria bacterium]